MTPEMDGDATMTPASVLVVDQPALPPPPCADGYGGRPRRHAPASTILAVLARVGSHVGDAETVTVTGTTHTVSVHVCTRLWRGWCDELVLPELGAGPATELVATVLHGWSLNLHRVA